MRPGRRLAPYSARRRSSTTPAPVASSRTAATANAIVEAPVLLRPLGSVASTLPFGLGLTAGFCGPGFSPSTFTRAFRAACSAASASAAWAGVASSSAATFFAASKAASNSSEPDLQSGSDELTGLRDHLVQSCLVDGLDSHLEGLREVRALERHRHRDLAGRSERLRQINRLTG